MTILKDRIESFPESSLPHCYPLWKMELFFRLWIPGYVYLLLCLGKAQGQTPLTEWTTAYSMEGSHEVAKNAILTTLPKLTTEWRVSFEVNPTDYKYTGYASLLHMTIGGNRGQVGDRSPAIWLHKTRGVLVASTIDGKVSYGKTVKPLPAAGKWTKIKVCQMDEGSKYEFSIKIANKKVFTKTNSKPVELKDVKVYLGSPWYTNQKGFVRNLKIETSTSNCVLAGKTSFVILHSRVAYNHKYLSQVHGAQHTPSKKSNP